MTIGLAGLRVQYFPFRQSSRQRTLALIGEGADII